MRRASRMTTAKGGSPGGVNPGGGPDGGVFAAAPDVAAAPAAAGVEGGLTVGAAGEAAGFAAGLGAGVVGLAALAALASGALPAVGATVGSCPQAASRPALASRKVRVRRAGVLGMAGGRSETARELSPFCVKAGLAAWASGWLVAQPGGFAVQDVKKAAAAAFFGRSYAALAGQRVALYRIGLKRIRLGRAPSSPKRLSLSASYSW